MIPGSDLSLAWMTRRYVLALGVIAFLGFAAFAVFESLMISHDSMIAVVNVSGRQRMLSQRTALFVRTLAEALTEAERVDARNQLKIATDRMMRTHHRLSDEADGLGPNNVMSDELRRMVFEGPDSVDQQMRAYFDALEAILAAPANTIAMDHPKVRYILTVAPGRLLARLDAVVSLYQEVGERALLRLRLLQGGVLVLLLATLALEARLIFRPMVHQARRQVDEIARITEELRHARDTLELQVAARTRELREAKEEAEKATVAKSRFLAAASHDLKQPLEAIGMFSGMLERRAGDERARAILNDLHGAQRSMRRLLDSLLDMSKLEAGVVRPRLESFPLQPMLQQVVNEFRPLAAGKGIEIRFVPTGTTVTSDPTMLERILRNLVSNAVQYSDRGRVLVGCRPVDGHARIEVHDTGHGIRDADLPLIFQEFSQLSEPDRDRSEGIGLGLAIVDRMSRLLDHPLVVRSQLGKGSLFAITVPTVERETGESG